MENHQKKKIHCLFNFKMKKRTNISKRQSKLYNSLVKVSTGIFRSQSNIYDGAFSAKMVTAGSCYFLKKSLPQIFHRVLNMLLVLSSVISLRGRFGLWGGHIVFSNLSIFHPEAFTLV